MRQFVVDTFTDRIFAGNPAAVCLPERWPEDEVLTRIARENGMSHTAFALREGDGWRLRWFTPGGEIGLCGHPTLAAAWVIFRFEEPGGGELRFLTRDGDLTVKRQGDLLEMDFPAYELKRLEVTDAITDALGARPAEVWRARDLLCVFDRAEDVVSLNPDMEKLKGLKGALMQVTAPGEGEYDCISRSFGPKVGMGEDPVCGSGHCHIIPYWAARTGKTEFTARQASPRGGTLYCRMEGDRVMIAGRAVLYARGELMLGGLE